MTTPGQSLTLHCTVTHSDSDVTIAYRWTREGILYRSDVQSITLVGTTMDDINGLYKCMVLLSVSGIHQADPVVWEVGQAVVTVGGKQFKVYRVAVIFVGSNFRSFRG